MKLIMYIQLDLKRIENIVDALKTGSLEIDNIKKS